MTTTYPTTLDTFTNPTPTDQVSVVSHAGQHDNINDAMAAVQTNLGVNGSAVTSTIDYLLKNTASVSPGHKHSASDFSAVTAYTVLGNATGSSAAPSFVTSPVISGNYDTSSVSSTYNVAGQRILGVNSSNSCAVGLYSGLTGVQNFCMGPFTMQYGGGNYNIAIGNLALFKNNQSSNIAIGTGAMASATAAPNNICIGSSAGGTTLTTGGGNILIGNSADVPTSSTSNYLNIGGCIIGAYAGTPALTMNAKLTMNGDIDMALNKLQNLVISKEVALVGALPNQTIKLQSYAPYGYTVNEVYQISTTSGTITAALKIGSTAITGLSAIAVTSTPQDVAATAANVVVAGNALNLVLSAGASTPTDLFFTIKATRN